jgi:dihydrofolate reductase
VRELVLKMSISLDGFVSDLAGENRWMFGGDPAARAWVVETISDASLHIMGSRTFRDMAGYWPSSADVFAPPMNQIPKAVFSRQGPAVLSGVDADGAGGWAQAYVAGGELAEEIGALKALDGKPIVAHGGASFARSLVAQGLVDQFALLVLPVAIGQGRPLFSELAAPARLKLVSSTAFPGGAVAQVYRKA